jgi:hypothetical protein
MALGEVQAALARLFTDEAARIAFLKDPPGAGRALGLDASDAARLAQMAPQALRRFAGALQAKRVQEARKRMPLTAQALGDSFAEHWRAAAASPAKGAGRVAEAQALARRLATLAKTKALAPAWIGDLASYEAAFVEAAQRRCGLRLRLFRFPVGTIAAPLSAGAPVGEIGRRLTLGVWARWPGERLWHRLWGVSVA